MPVAPTPSASGEEVVHPTADEESSTSSPPRNDAATITARQYDRFAQHLLTGGVLGKRRKKLGNAGRVWCAKCGETFRRQAGAPWSGLHRAAVEHVRSIHPVSFAAHCAGGAE